MNWRSQYTTASAWFRALWISLSLGFVGFGALIVASLTGYLGLFLIGHSTPLTEEVVSTVAGQGLALSGTALGYLYLRYDGFDVERIVAFLRIRTPTRRELGLVVLGLFGSLIVDISALMLIEVFEPFGSPEPATHSSIEEGRKNPILFVVDIPLAILLVGPGEELLYRGVIQSRLRETFPTAIAVITAGLVFAVIHYPAFTGAGLGPTLSSLSLILVSGIYFGALYEYSDNLVVPALVHGLGNALIALLNLL